MASSEIDVIGTQVQVHETTVAASISTDSVVIATTTSTSTTTESSIETSSTEVTESSSSASVVETATISKRAAKKMKKALYAAQDAGVRKDEEENANNIATIDHPYLSFLHKRIRSYKKKLEKIKSLETARSEEGKVRKCMM